MQSNANRPMMLANLFELVPILLMILPVYDVATAPREFEVRIYKAFKQMHIEAVLAAFGFGFGCITTLVTLAFNREKILLELLAAVMQGIGCAAMFYAQSRERKFPTCVGRGSRSG